MNGEASEAIGKNHIGAATPWIKLSAEEKMERMREIIHSLLSSENRLRQDIDQLKRDFKSHDHLNGRVVSPLEERGIKMLGGSVVGTRQNPEEAYF